MEPVPDSDDHKDPAALRDDRPALPVPHEGRTRVRHDERAPIAPPCAQFVQPNAGLDQSRYIADVSTGAQMPPDISSRQSWQPAWAAGDGGVQQDRRGWGGGPAGSFFHLNHGGGMDRGGPFPLAGFHPVGPGLGAQVSMERIFQLAEGAQTGALGGRFQVEGPGAARGPTAERFWNAGGQAPGGMPGGAWLNGPGRMEGGQLREGMTDLGATLARAGTAENSWWMGVSVRGLGAGGWAA